MEELRELLEWLRPGEDFAQIDRHTRLMEDLQLSSCDGLALVAMIEAHYSRTFAWERELCTVGDLLDDLAAQGVDMEEAL